METAARSEHSVRFKNFELDLLTRELHRNGRKIKLHGHPIDVLAILLERPGELVTREELKKGLWPKDTFVDFEQILNNSISMLRDALGDRAEEPRFIETLPRQGYRFIAPVTIASALGNGPGSSNGDADTLKNNETNGSPQTPSAPGATPIRNRLLWSTTLVIGLITLISVGSLAYLRARRAATLQQGKSQSEFALQTQPVTNAPGSAIFPAFSPDGREAAFLWDGPKRRRYDVYVQLLGAGTPLRLTHSKDGTLGAPAWSPDGREIAFSRCGGKNAAVYVVPALGGVERELTHVGCPYNDPGRLAWLPGGQEMLMIDHCPEGGTFDLVAFSLASGTKRCLTHSDPRNALESVYRFSLSPDSRTVAFTASAAAPCFGDIYTIPLLGGSPRLVTNEGRCFTDLMWTPDGKSIVLGSYQSVGSSLWRVSADGGPVQRETTYPNIGSFSRDGRHFVYSHQTVAEGPTIWRADLASAGGPVLKNREVIRTQFPEMAPQTSPDGTRIVWRSDRTGYGQIWTSGANGENPRQLTHLDWYSGAPRWSPDGKWIAFNKVKGNGRQIFIVDSEGRGLRQITEGPFENAEASWSRDGRSIYFSSMRTGSWQVWKHSLENGAELQITKQGGFEPFEAYDGRTVYYSRFYQAGIWSVPASGGTESLIIADAPELGYWGYWGVTSVGLYVLNAEAEPGPRIEFYSLATRRTSPVLTLGKKSWLHQSSLSATADGKTIYYTLYDQQSVIKMIDISR